MLFERNKEICIDVLTGYTLQEVADNNGVTRERVRQILSRGIRKACTEYWKEIRFKDEHQGVYTYRKDKDILIPLIRNFAPYQKLAEFKKEIQKRG